MRSVSLIVILLGMPATVVAADDAKDELKKLEGVWSVVEVHNDGKVLDKNVFPVGKITIKGDTMKVGDNDALQFAIDVTTMPRQLDTKNKDGKVETRLIYSLEGDNLKLAFEFALFQNKPLERPTTFDTKGNATVLLVLKRDKK